ncbi:MAG TPA: HD domain-containing protein [Acidimicrobiales bacterium]|nr:HD domain-containing protein [Acidimicrobiales bacterium]
MPKPPLADAVEAALAWHGDQRRKDGSPYVSHLLQVAGLVLEHGGSMDAAVAAVLHDVVEDTGATLDDVRDRFGPVVAGIVESCTDSLDLPRGPATWRARKDAYLAHLATGPPDAALVSACDTLHNLRSRVLTGVGGFNASAEDRAWFYEQVVTLLAARGDVPEPLVAELRSLSRRAWR